MQIGLIALDERPVNTRYPEMIAAMTGATVLQPPPELRSQYKQQAKCDEISTWLREHAPQMDALIVSIETLAYGGLVLSRITHESIATITARLEVLREIKQQNPHLTIYGFDLILRISYSNSAAEEPPYWVEHGNRIYRYSQTYDRAMQGQDVQAELEALRDELPTEVLTDFVKRRMRNHAVNLAVLELLAEGVFDLLVISSDDTSEYGMGSREKRWINEWIERRGGDERVLLYPGADEVGCALLARILTSGDAQRPTFAIHYSIPDDQDKIAPFEDGPISMTVERQIRAVGGEIAAGDDADFIVAVNPPAANAPRIYDYSPAFGEAERAYRLEPLTAFVEQIRAWVEAGKQVIVADVAYPNGSDPILVDLLREKVDMTKLAAYGGWNTAGNTTGTALAQGIAAARTQDETERLRFLLHRFVEDWAYQHITRKALQDWLDTQYNTRNIDADNITAGLQFIEQHLNQHLQDLPGFAGRWTLRPGSVRLPWQRTFEVDFDLEQLSQ